VCMSHASRGSLLVSKDKSRSKLPVTGEVIEWATKRKSNLHLPSGRIHVFRRYLVRRGTHLLLWGIGLTFYSIGGFCEAYYGAFGWNPLVFRLWYLFGAILVAAWLGQGTVYLLASRKWANGLMVLLGLASAYAAVRGFIRATTPMRPPGK